MKVVNGWARFDIAEVCGATHIWHLYEEGMPCLCGELLLSRLPSGDLWQQRCEPRPNIAYRFGVMSHFIEGECECHPPESLKSAGPTEELKE